MSDPAIEAAQRAYMLNGVADTDFRHVAIVAAREALKSIRDRHTMHRCAWCRPSDVGWCDYCKNPWPCADARDSYSTKEIEELLGTRS